MLFLLIIYSARFRSFTLLSRTLLGFINCFLDIWVLLTTSKRLLRFVADSSNIIRFKRGTRLSLSLTLLILTTYAFRLTRCPQISIRFLFRLVGICRGLVSMSYRYLIFLVWLLHLRFFTICRLFRLSFLNLRMIRRAQSMFSLCSLLTADFHFLLRNGWFFDLRFLFFLEFLLEFLLLRVLDCTWHQTRAIGNESAWIQVLRFVSWLISFERSLWFLNLTFLFLFEAFHCCTGTLLYAITFPWLLCRLVRLLPRYGRSRVWYSSRRLRVGGCVIDLLFNSWTFFCFLSFFCNSFWFRLIFLPQFVSCANKSRNLNLWVGVEVMLHCLEVSKARIHLDLSDLVLIVLGNHISAKVLLNHHCRYRLLVVS